MSRLPYTSLAYALLQAARIDAAVFAGQSLAEGLVGRVDAVARPAVQDLVYGSLRQYGRGDFFLSRLLDRPLPVEEVRAGDELDDVRDVVRVPSEVPLGSEVVRERWQSQCRHRHEVLSPSS